MQLRTPHLLLFLVFTLGCLPRGLNYKSPGDFKSKTAAGLEEVRVTTDPFANSTALPGRLTDDLRAIPTLLNGETIWAMAQCNCLLPTKTDIFKTYATAEGALPQVMVPRVREEIRKNKQLQVLVKLPGGLSAILKKVLAGNETINDKVQDSLGTKIEKVVNADLKKNIDFRFDHFLVTDKDFKKFAIQDMTARWNLVFSTGYLWRNKQPMAFSNHGLQLLESLRTLSEWKYMYGLDENSTGGFYGGLTLDPAELSNHSLKRFDPRTEPDGQRMLSGIYKLKLPENAEAIDLVLNVKEEWVHSDTSIPTIMEQAMLWNAAAFAFAQVRPDQRHASTEVLFGAPDVSLLPVETHMLPLAFLKGLQGLLEKKFLDKEGREVASVIDPKEVVDLKVLARLGRALFSWLSVLKNLENAKITPTTLTNLQTAPEKLSNALRLVLLVIFREGYVNNFGQQSTADLAEAISLMADVEQGLMPSPLLREKVLNSFHRLVNERLGPAWNSQSGKVLNVQDLLWCYMAASAINKYPPAIHQASWLPGLVQNLESKLGKREGFPWQNQ